MGFRIILELSCKYGSLCAKVSWNILHNQNDVEECVNDSYLAVWNAIPPQRPKPLVTFLCRIVKNISINRLEKETAGKRNSGFTECLDDWQDKLASDENLEDKVLAAEVSGYISEFLKKANTLDRKLFVRKYWYMDSYESLARTTGMREGAIRTRLSRMRKDLKRFLKKKGVNVQ